MESYTIRVYLQPDPQFPNGALAALHSLLTSLKETVEVVKIEEPPTSYFFVEFGNAHAADSAVLYLHNQFFKFGTVRAYKLGSRGRDLLGCSGHIDSPRRKIGVPMNLFSYKPNSFISSGDNSHLSKKNECDAERRDYVITKIKTSPPPEGQPTKCKKSPDSKDNAFSYENSPKMKGNGKGKIEMSPDESCFLNIANLSPKFLNHKVTINLACCFGNAHRVYVDQPAGRTIIRYQNANDAMRAKFHLRDQLFFGSRLQILDSMPEDIDLATSLPTGVDLKMFDCKAPDFRYKDTLNVKYNAPSAVLHFTNLSENCTPQVLFQIISAIHEPRKIVKLAKKSVNSTNMMLVLFKSVTESLEVLTVLHNKIVDHKSLRVSFSHTKLT
jgi:hypothetical protein